MYVCMYVSSIKSVEETVTVLVVENRVGRRKILAEVILQREKWNLF